MTIIESDFRREQVRIKVTFDTERNEFGVVWNNISLMRMDGTLFLTTGSDLFTPFVYIQLVLSNTFEMDYGYSEEVIVWKYKFLDKVSHAVDLG